MSRRQIDFMRALVQGILAGLAVLLLSGMRLAMAQAPAGAQLNLLPLTRGLQDQLVLTHSLASGLGAEAPRVVLLPPAAKPATAAGAPVPAALVGGIQPSSLFLAMDAALAQPVVPPPAVTGTATASAADMPVAGTAPATGRVPAPAAAPALAPAPANRLRPAAGMAVVADTAPLAAPTALRLSTHHSLLVESPDPLVRVAIADETIAQAIVVSPHQVLVQGKAPGEVSLLLWGTSPRPQSYTVDVALDPAPLQRELDRLFPTAELRVSDSGDALALTGTLANAAQAKQALAVAKGFSPKVVDNLSVDPAGDPGQVLLQVRFAEVDRSAATQIGANLMSTAPGLVGQVGTGQFGAPSSVTTPVPQSVPNNSLTGRAATFGLGDLLNVFLFNRNANLGLLIRSLQQQNLLQILAQPNLVAMDGKDASFLAGGEFPFPVVQGQGSTNNITIQFKPFGVNLHFKPTILADGTIDLQVAPEVSALDFSNALTVSGFLIPALSTRRAQTELELRDGQSFVIAGLMDNRVTKNLSKIPGLSSIPILGKFFQSQTTNKSDNELVVVVTAHLVKPSATAAKGPAMPQPFLNTDKFDGVKPGAKK